MRTHFNIESPVSKSMVVKLEVSNEHRNEVALVLDEETAVMFERTVPMKANLL